MKFIYTKAFKRAFAIFVLVSLIMISDSLGYITRIKIGFLRVYTPIARGSTNAAGSVKEFFVTFGTIKNLAKENAALEQQVDELAFENARLQLAKQENIALRRALKLEEESKLLLTPAEIVTLDPTGFSQTITMRVQDISGLKEGAAVIVSPGILVGRVTKVTTNFVEATLITDHKVLINAEVVDSGAKGLVRGEHGLSLALDLVTQNELIKVGDRVVTSGLSNDFPRGLLIGDISGIRSGTSELFQKASISPAANLKNLRFVFIAS